jgi:hypothetical protein
MKMIQFAALSVLIGTQLLSAPAQATDKSFETILRCDNGAVEVDVRTDERRLLRLKINDQNILQYFLNKDGFSRERLDIGLSDGTLYLGSHHGIFDSAQFQSARAHLGGEYDQVFLDAYREGEGLKVVSRYVRPSMFQCVQPLQVNEGYFICLKQEVAPGFDPNQWSNMHERANWYFRKCVVVR